MKEGFDLSCDSLQILFKGHRLKRQYVHLERQLALGFMSVGEAHARATVAPSTPMSQEDLLGSESATRLVRTPWELQGDHQPSRRPEVGGDLSPRDNPIYWLLLGGKPCGDHLAG